MSMHATEIPDPEVVVRGDVPAGAPETAAAKLRAACASAPRPVLFARLALSMAADPARERPAVANASVDVSGQHVRAHVAASTMEEAIDRMADRVRRGVHALQEEHRPAAPPWRTPPEQAAEERC